MTMKRRSFVLMLFVLPVLLTATFIGCQPAEEPADLVLRGGKIVTMDDLTPEAEALAIRGDTIVAVGSNQEIEPFVGPATEVVELDGHLAIPGLIEGHGHFLGVGHPRCSSI